jgi:hypothetical protein
VRLQNGTSMVALQNGTSMVHPSTSSASAAWRKISRHSDTETGPMTAVRWVHRERNVKINGCSFECAHDSNCSSSQHREQQQTTHQQPTANHQQRTHQHMQRTSSQHHIITKQQANTSSQQQQQQPTTNQPKTNNNNNQPTNQPIFRSINHPRLLSCAVPGRRNTAATPRTKTAAAGAAAMPSCSAAERVAPAARDTAATWQSLGAAVECGERKKKAKKQKPKTKNQKTKTKKQKQKQKKTHAYAIKSSYTPGV